MSLKYHNKYTTQNLSKYSTPSRRATTNWRTHIDRLMKRQPLPWIPFLIDLIWAIFRTLYKSIICKNQQMPLYVYGLFYSKYSYQQF
jgi:hypothetical protein